MLDWILDRYRPFCGEVVLVVRPDDRALIEDHVRDAGNRIVFAEQTAPTGMLDAILCGRELALDSAVDRVWITWCDQVLISRATVDRLASCETQMPNAAVVFPTSRQPNPYIHFDRSPDGGLSGVRQRREGDDLPALGESDAGLFSLSRAAIDAELPAFARESRLGRLTGERNFLPFLPWIAVRAEVVTFDIPVHETLGVNTPEDRATAEHRLMRES